MMSSNSRNILRNNRHVFCKLALAQFALSAVLTTGCFSSESARTGDLSIDLHSKDRVVVMAACRQAVEKKDPKAIPHLIFNLRSPHIGVRMWAHTALQKITKQNFSYHYYANQDEQEVAIQKWEQWAQDSNKQKN